MPLQTPVSRQIAAPANGNLREPWALFFEQLVTLLNTAPISAATPGVMRIGTVQVAWGSFTSGTGTPPSTEFSQPFADASYALVLTPLHNSTVQRRSTQVLTKTEAGFTAQTFNEADGLSGVGGSYIAIGAWT